MNKPKNHFQKTSFYISSPIYGTKYQRKLEIKMNMIDEK